MILFIMGKTIILDGRSCGDTSKYRESKLIDTLVTVDNKIDLMGEILRTDELDRCILVEDLRATVDDIIGSGLIRLFQRALMSRNVVGLNNFRSSKCILNRGPGIGNFGAKFLLIGERPGNKNPQFSKIDYPFFSTKGASKWLTDELERAGINELDLYWTNVFDRYGDKLDGSFITQMPNLISVFALGNVAKDWCAENFIPAVNVYHPQYWKRFKANEPYPLIEKLKQLI